MDIRVAPGAHPAEELLEKYALGRFLADDRDALEDHLLLCEECQDELHELDLFILAVRHADRLLKPPNARRVFVVSRPALAASLAAACVTAVAVWSAYPQGGSSFTVRLEATRGTHTPAPSGKPLMLSMDLSELPPASGYRLHVVSASGDIKWQGLVRREGFEARVPVPEKLPRGTYWVRLYSESVLLREYALQLE